MQLQSCFLRNTGKATVVRRGNAQPVSVNPLKLPPTLLPVSFEATPSELARLWD